MCMDKKYFLGLDVGSSSVGWAVTDEDYNLLELNGKTAWGSRLFDKSQDAKARRSKRSARRRMARRKFRIDILNNYIFKDEINKIDPSFFIRLNESNLVLEDKSVNVKYPLFLEKDKEKEFYKKYPTIYHLRLAQVENKIDAFSDIRYLYLTIHHIIKKRGNFLTEGEFNVDSLITPEMIENCDETLLSLLEEEHESIINEKIVEDVRNILKNKSKDLNKKDKQKMIKKLFPNGKELFSSDETEKYWNNLIELFAVTVTGGTKTFKINDSEKTISFDKNYDENRSDYESVLDKNIVLLDLSKQIYFANYIEDFLGKEKYFSSAMVNVYERYKKDLKLLKSIIKKLNRVYPSLYNQIFKGKVVDKKNQYFSVVPNYNAYANEFASFKYGEVKGHDGFIKQLKAFIKEVLKDEACIELIEKDALLKTEIEELTTKINDDGDNDYLKRIADINNSEFPHQFHEEELKKILDNCKPYFPSIYANKDKILSIFRYRVNYYEGPLDTRSKYSNVIKKGNEYEKILPWNKKDIIDKDETMNNFIKGLINDCTYLIGEKVLPKCSIILNDLINLNKLNVLRINGDAINQEAKLRLFDFINQNPKTTISAIKKFLIKEFDYYDKNGVVISGIDEDGADFISPVRPYLSKVFDLNNDNVVKEIDEKIIETLTIYADDKKGGLEAVKNKMPNLSEAQLKAIEKLNCKDWGTLSRKLLKHRWHDDNGVVTRSLLDIMHDEVINLQQVLEGDKYKFREYIAKDNTSKIGKMSRRKQIEELIEKAPPLMRRSAIQAYKIAYEIRKITKSQPEKIMIETTRSHEKKDKNGKGKIKDSRRKELEALIKSLINDKEIAYSKDAKRVLEELKALEDDARLRGEAIYLYFKQLGRDMYTLEPIAFEDVLNSTKYDIDHIVPQSKILDNSLDNKVLVDKNINQKIKSDIYPLPREIVKKCIGFWKMLYEKKFISAKKYNSLIRETKLTEEEKDAFVARQINVVNYSNILIRDIFNIAFPESEIIFQKAEHTSFIRNEYDIVKVRELNDTHHAVDAYLNVVAGNILSNYYKLRKIKANEKTGKDSLNPETVIKGYFEYTDGKLDLVKNTCERKDILLTFREKYPDGQFYDQNIVARPSKSGKNELIPVHTNSKFQNINVYGGFNNLSRSYFVSGFDNKNKKIMVSIPIMYSNIKNQDELHKKICENYELDISKNTFDYTQKIMPSSLIQFQENGEKYLMNSSNKILIRLAPIIPLFLDKSLNNYLKIIYKRKDEVEKCFDDLEKAIKIDLSIEFPETLQYQRDKNGEHYDIVSIEDNIKLKNELLIEINKPERAFSSDKENIKEIKKTYLNENFDNLNLNEQIKNIINSISLFNRSFGTFRITMNKFINMNPILVKTSVTGLYEKKIKL